MKNFVVEEEDYNKICLRDVMCVEVCPFKVIELTEEPILAVTYGMVISATRRIARVKEGCTGCGS